MDKKTNNQKSSIPKSKTTGKTTNGSVRTQTNKATNKNKSSKGKKVQSKRHRRLKKRIRWALLLFSLIFSLTMLIGFLVFYVKYGEDFISYQKEAKQVVGQSNLDTFRQSETSLVYDANGDLISVLKGEKDVYYIEYKEIPKAVIEAMISIEDKKFKSHEGVDLLANVRAFLTLIKNQGEIKQGASTITQQLTRNVFLSNEVSYERKFKEIFIALELEKKYNKNQIMEFYLNNIYFANGFYGIQAASKGYFNKDVGELSLSQIAFLCAVPNNPTIYDPFDYPENTKGRRDRILLQMYEDGKIGYEEYETACKEEMELVQKKIDKNNYVETYVYYCAARALMETQGFVFQYEFQNDEEKKVYDEAYSELYNQCHKALYYEGYRIYTSIDISKQEELQKAVDNTLANYEDKNEEGIYSLQGAAVSIDNETGRVVAIVGGRYQKTAGYTLNRGYQSYRQPGSAIKPLIVYTPIFERGYYPDDIVLDEKFEGGPSNSNGVYSGNIQIRKAVEVSKNTVAWKLFEELTPKVGLSYLLKMNFNKIDKNDYYPAASLGGFTNGASPVEMTAAYAALENDGVYREPTSIITILDSDGNTIVSDYISSKRIYESNAARIMTNVLTGVIKSGSGKGMALDNMISAGKTGTTNDKKDGWFVGYTSYYTTGVWVGYDIPKAMPQLSGSTFPGSIWKQYMNVIHKDLKKVEFETYLDTRPKEEIVEEPEDEEELEENLPEIPDDTLGEPEEEQEDLIDPEDENIYEDPDDWENGWEDDLEEEDNPVDNPDIPVDTITPTPTVEALEDSKENEETWSENTGGTAQEGTTGTPSPTPVN